MNEEQAKTIHAGDTVLYRGLPHRVNSVKRGEVTGPHFRLTNLETGEGVSLVSWRLVGLPPLTEQQARCMNYVIVRGLFGTIDDRADRWYIQDRTSGIIDRRGSGFPSKDAALAYLAESLAVAGLLEP